jgi:hypothetical protein
MLDAVVANFVEAVSEREFDAPFMALLRARDFYDIHFTHGNYEFGKDFIAKFRENGVERQYVFQSKAGNFNLGGWAGAAPQIELLRHSEVAHPNFDSRLPRQAVFVMTGRLTGGALTAAQDFCRQCAGSDVPLITWDRETLIEYMVAAIGSGLAERIEAPLLATVASAANRTATEMEIERFSQRWCIRNQQPSPAVLEAAIVAAALQKAGRIDLAVYAGLALVRAASWQAHGINPVAEDWSDVASLGRRLFAMYAASLLERLGAEGGPSTSTMIGAHREPAALITHTVRCVRIAEIISLFGLLGPTQANDTSSREIAGWLSRFLRRQNVAAAPISDRWAVAIIPIVLLLAKEGQHGQAADYMREVLIWITQRYRDGLGLASPTATPEAEVRQVIGRVVPQVQDIQRRDASYLATVFLDLCAFLDLKRLYAFARDDFRRFSVFPSVVTTADTADQYLLDGPDVAHEINAPYTDTVAEEWTSVAPHLAAEARPRFLQEIDRPWDHLAVSYVLRDRHFVCAWPALSLKAQ